MSELSVSSFPVMPLRDIVIFPGMVAPLVVGRKNSIRALEYAMGERSLIFLVTQKDAGVDEPKARHLYSWGTLAAVMQLLRLPDGTIKALVEGKRRARIDSISEDEIFYTANVIETPDTETEGPELKAYTRELRRTFDKYTKANKKIPPEVLKTVTTIENPSRLVDLICAHIPLKTEEKQEILEIIVLPERISRVLEVLYREMELFELEKTIHVKVKKKMAETQRNYYLGEKIKVIHDEMGQGEGGDDLAEIEEAIKKKNLPKQVKDKVVKELKKLRQMPPMSAETTVVRN